ncbi:DUF6302 family protein [Streptomyces sp. NPDC007346]|uniref:DUF6302 family protein n=1 Tax=Streptomyces sp. NPDC007346 TaxID=3154682 RepID=UPI003453484E
MSTVAPPALAVLVPLSEVSEPEVAYYRQRLDDPSLLERALGVQVEGTTYLAVPAGGCRRGGFVSVSEVVTGLAVRSLLRDRPEFPDVRLSWSPYADTCHVVRWGPPLPYDDDPVAEGRFYGYRAETIAAFMRAHGHLT